MVCNLRFVGLYAFEVSCGFLCGFVFYGSC